MEEQREELGGLLRGFVPERGVNRYWQWWFVNRFMSAPSECTEKAVKTSNTCPPAHLYKDVGKPLVTPRLPAHLSLAEWPLPSALFSARSKRLYILLDIRGE